MSTDGKLNEYFERPETDSELLPVVDENDQVVRLATRRNIHSESLLHRAVHVILHDDDGRVLLQKRSERKDHLPGWWDVSVGGHVGPNEDYAQAAVREIAEEMGVAGAEPQWIGRLLPTAETGWEFIHVFEMRVSGEVTPDPAEISDIAWLSRTELIRLTTVAYNPESSEVWRISPAGLKSLRLFIELKSNLWT